jgi:hypothetical protein
LAYINQAHLILFLVSPDFLASDACYEEMKLAMRRMNTKEVSVIPFLMRHTAGWQDTPLGILVNALESEQLLPSNVSTCPQT